MRNTPYLGLDTLSLPKNVTIIQKPVHENDITLRWLDFLCVGKSFEAEGCSFQKVECPRGVLFEMGKPAEKLSINNPLQ
jgi:hypothetical protein